MFFHVHKLGVDPQAPFFIPSIIPQENQESCDQHSKESASNEINQNGSEKALIDDPAEDHATGSYNHEIKEHGFPHIETLRNGDPLQEAADVLSERIISEQLRSLFSGHIQSPFVLDPQRYLAMM